MGRVNIIETNFCFRQELEERSVTDFFVIHHIGELTRDVSAAEIHQWHLDRGWAGIGYHFVIRPDGTIERGRPQHTKGSHCYGYNSQSVGINVVGNFQVACPTSKQIKALTALLADLCEEYGLTPGDNTIVGHRDKTVTDCPGNNLYLLLPVIRAKAFIS